ncbi:MAG: rubrerythrin [Planctomycetes bacterium RBG_13_63_9]|nr:MAG: rubrerythrin [Planctomycetes bacterium RBG_13_63_9]
MTSQWNSTEEILDFAIKNEERAAQFYTDLAGKMDSGAMGEVFEEFAKEEQRHKAKLLGVKQSGTMEPASGAVLDLKIGDYLVDAEPGPDMDYQDALILAMKQEKAAFKLYTDLAAATSEAALRALLLGLAQEEAKHKLRFEVEYDEQILTEN